VQIVHVNFLSSEVMLLMFYANNWRFAGYN